MKHTRLIGFGTAESNAYIGPAREITVDTDRLELRLHDGVTPGGRRLLNESQIAAFGSLHFVGIMNVGLAADQALDATAVRRLVNVSAVGGARNLTLPPLADFDIGQDILIRATSANVTLRPQAGEGWIDAGAETADFAYPIPNNQIITIAKMSPTRFLVMAKR